MAKIAPFEWAYNMMNLDKLTQWAANGLTYKQIAHNIGISASTLDAWRKKFPTVELAISKGKGTADEEVIGALFKRCIGYDYEEKRSKAIVNKETGEKLCVIEETVITHHIPGDVKAQVFWLTNKKQEEWKTKREDADAGKDITIRIEGGDGYAD